MRTRRLLTTAALLGLGACAPAISVRTAVSPDASLRGLQTFRVLPTPQPKIAGADSSTNDLRSPIRAPATSQAATRAPIRRHRLASPAHVDPSQPPQRIDYIRRARLGPFFAQRPDLPAAFARPAAYGDLGAAILTLLALAVLATSWGLVVVWLFNLWGAVDLLYGFSHGLFGVGLSPASLGAGFFLITVIVPLLLITHGLIFRLLLQPPLSQTRRG